jgi:hypothetical protein
MNSRLMITRPMTYPAASWRNVMFPPNADAGTPMNDSVLVSVATMVKHTAHQGMDRSVRK